MAIHVDCSPLDKEAGPLEKARLVMSREKNSATSASSVGATCVRSIGGAIEVNSKVKETSAAGTGALNGAADALEGLPGIKGFGKGTGA